MNIRTSLVAGAASAISLVAATPALANGTQLGFDGVYAPSNWTFSNTDANGSVDPTAAPNSITITGGNNGSGFPGSTNYLTTIAANGTLMFSWDYPSQDSITGNDSFGYLLNGNFNFLTSTANESGFSVINVFAGDTFGFGINTIDNRYGPGIATISSFSAPVADPAPVPAPLPILGSALAFSSCRRLRKQSQRLRHAAGQRA